jgi:ribosomal protein S18 acetylase RimI-like enzyme
MQVMSSNLQILPMQKNDLDCAFSIYKATLEEVVTKAFGWNEEFQRNRFWNRYQPDWFHWIELDNERIGFICFYQSDLEMHISLMMILPEKQRCSYGRQVMLHLHDHARQSSRKVTLSSFKQNFRAIRFYETLGYKVVESDEHFVDMEWIAL